MRAWLVLPGQSPETTFGENAWAMMRDQGVSIPEAYSEFARPIFERMTSDRAGPFTTALDVAQAIWRAVNEPSCPMRQPAGARRRGAGSGPLSARLATRAAPARCLHRWPLRASRSSVTSIASSGRPSAGASSIASTNRCRASASS